MKGTIAVSGALAQRPYIGGHTWVFLQYLLGFRRLGWDVVFLDWLGPAMCVDEHGRPAPADRSVNVRYLCDVMRGFGLEHCFALVLDGGERFIGLSRRQVIDRLGEAPFLLNVNGYLVDQELLGHAAKRVFLDIDPGFLHMWQDMGLHDPFQGHDAFVTIGQNIGQADCVIPTCGREWITTPQPVVLDQWPVCADAPRGAFTSIATWRGAFGPLNYKGKTYGLRVHEFRKLVQLPGLTGRRFELALDIDPVETRDIDLLRENDWTLLDPAAVARDPWVYREFVQGSEAEFMVAKTMYVETRSGWMSDRSICYLASGKPVVVQDTGLSGLYPLGEGLLAYSTLEEAVHGVGEISDQYDRHARAARAIAQEYFDSDRVLSRLLEQLGIA